MKKTTEELQNECQKLAIDIFELKEDLEASSDTDNFFVAIVVFKAGNNSYRSWPQVYDCERAYDFDFNMLGNGATINDALMRLYDRLEARVAKMAPKSIESNGYVYERVARIKD